MCLTAGDLGGRDGRGEGGSAPAVHADHEVGGTVEEQMAEHAILQHAQRSGRAAAPDEGLVEVAIPGVLPHSRCTPPDTLSACTRTRRSSCAHSCRESMHYVSRPQVHLT